MDQERNDELCGTCAYHRRDPWEEEPTWICDCARSECYGCVTEYRDTCDDYEGRF